MAFWCVTSSHRVPPFPSWKSLLTLLSWILQSDIWELIEGYGEKGNILRKKLERSFLRTSFAMWEFNSQSYMFLLRDPFAYTLFLKSAMGYVLAPCSWRRQGKSSDQKVKEAFWEFAFWCVTSSLRVTPLFLGAVSLDCFRGFWEVIFSMGLKSGRTKEISFKKNQNEDFWETALWSVNSFHSVIPPFHGGFS